MRITSRSLSRASALFIFLIASTALQSQVVESKEAPLSRILFILDASNSMAGNWKGEIKMDMAREVLNEMLDSLEKRPNLELALRVYGHQSPVPPQDCSDTKLEVPFAFGNADAIRAKLTELEPKGTTPIARSLQQAPGDFPKGENCRNIILLITDGIEACDGDPCLVSRELQRTGVILRPFVIGIGTDPGFRETFNCIGDFVDASSKKEFKGALERVIIEALNITTAQVKLLDHKKQPTEKDVNIILEDYLNGQLFFQTIHTLNQQGISDTLYLDPLKNYRLVVQTIPPIRSDEIRLAVGRHNTISMDAPQGFLYIKTSRGQAYVDQKALIRQADSSRTINIQQIGNVGKYLVGSYDIEIPIYPRMELKDVVVEQGNTTTIEIMAPGLVTFQSSLPGSGVIYRKEKDGSQTWVMNLPEHYARQSYFMQPGNYMILFRRRDQYYSSQTSVREFSVYESSPLHVKID